MTTPVNTTIASAFGLTVPETHPGTDIGNPPGATIFSSYPLPYVERGAATAFTVYHKWDMVTYKGARVVMRNDFTTGADPVFIGATNYQKITQFGHFWAEDYGAVANALQANGASNIAAINKAILDANPTQANAVGAFVHLPPGNMYISAPIQPRSGIHLMGDGPFGSYVSLTDGANCHMIDPYRYLGSGPPNAFYYSIRDLSLDCRQAQQGRVATTVTIVNGSATISHPTTPWQDNERLWGSGIPPDTKILAGTQAGAGPFTATMSALAVQSLSDVTVYCGLTNAIHAVHLEPNGLVSPAPGDWAFDPSGYLLNVIVKNARDAAFCNLGRSANVYERCKTSVSLGFGFIGSFDSRYVSCESDFSAWHGFTFRGSSEQIIGNKSYNSGQVKTSATAVSNQAHGYVFDGFTGFGGIAFAGNDAQQNTGNAFHLITCTGVALAGCTASQVGYTSAVTTNVGVYMSACDNCTFVGSVNVQASNHCYLFINGSTDNTIITGYSGTSKGTPAAPGNTDTGNFIIVGGTAINAPGLVSSATLDSAYPKRYSLATSTGSHHNIGVSGTQGIAVLNRLELVPYFPERGAAQTITEVTFRVGSTSVATAVLRQGIFSSDKNGGLTFTLEQELPAPVVADTTAVIHTTAFASPIAVDPTKLYWVGSSPQTALATFQTSYADLVAGSTSNPTGGYCFTINGVSGAFAASYTFGGVTGPVHLSGGISVGVTATG